MAKKARGAAEKLTAKEVERAKAPGLYGDGKGLWLRVGDGAAKSWILRYMLGGRAREMGLGSYADYTLAEARERARHYRKQIKDEGIDPIERRRARRGAERTARAKTMTFRECAEAYIRAHAPGWRSVKHAAQWPAFLGAHVYPVFGSLPVATIDTPLVMRALEPMWQRTPETASRVRGRIESVLDWAKARGYRDGENPARWRGHLENLLAAKSRVRRVEHYAALPYAALPEFMAELRSQSGVAARALEFAVLSAGRTGEVLGAKWDEVDRAEAVWAVPPARMKAHKEHRIPLCDRAIAILAEMEGINREGAFVFPGRKSGQPLAHMALLEVLRRMGRANLTVHGFRSTFSDWAAERTNFPAEVREMALAHSVADKVEAAYRRGDLFQKRRQLAAAWGRYCAAPVAATGNVVALGAAGR
jgi:integrase